jgi:hypothetical protein
MDYAAIDDQANRLRELVKARVLGIDLEKATNALESFLIPFFENIRPMMKESGLTELDCGQGIAQATLVAVDLGLGTACLGSAKEAEIKENLHLPETAKVLVLQCVGYSAESIEAGGQRPRRPFESLFSLNEVGTAFPRSEEVVSELEASRMFQEPAPLPWRQAELEYLQKGLDLPDF